MNVSAKNTLTRREACAVLGALGAGALGLAGCGTGGDTTSRTGYSSDTEVKSYPVHLKLYADSYTQWQISHHVSHLDGQKTKLDSFIERYPQQKDRSGVSIEVVYVDSAELLALAREGFPDGDGLIALRDTMGEGIVSGTVDAGVANLYVRDLNYHFTDYVRLVRAVGGDANLPPTETLTGENSSVGTINQLQQLPHFDGMIALASPEATLEGRLANAALAVEEFYQGLPSGRGGLIDGTYDESIAAKIATYPSQDAAMAAVVAGECQLGFALHTSLARRYPEVEVAYRPLHATAYYNGTSLPCSPEPGVMRDFLEFVTSCYD
jgi:hypothetical protein